MATGKAFPWIPIQLSRSSEPISLRCPYDGILVQSSLFVAPVVLNGHGYFYAAAPAVETSVSRKATGNGSILFGSSCNALAWVPLTASGKFRTSSHAELVCYNKTAALHGGFSFSEQEVETKKFFALEAESSMSAKGASAITTMSRMAAASDIKMSMGGTIKTTRDSYASRNSAFMVSDLIGTEMYGYEHYIPSDDEEALIDTDNEIFVTRRSDDNGA